MTVEALIRDVKNADSAQKLVQSVAKLAATKDPAGIATLVEVLKFNNPGAAVTAVGGLIQIGTPVVPYLLENIDGYNYGARAWMLRVFAGIGDPRALDLLIEAANTDFSLSVRRAAAKGLGNIQWEQLAADERSPKQRQVLDSLLLALEDGEWVVRYGAIAGLEGLAQELPTALQQKMLAKLQAFVTQETEITVRARGKKALSQFHQS
jgi:phycocyanobilin lyase beta subunit